MEVWWLIIEIYVYIYDNDREEMKCSKENTEIDRQSRRTIVASPDPPPIDDSLPLQQLALGHGAQPLDARLGRCLLLPDGQLLDQTLSGAARRGGCRRRRRCPRRWGLRALVRHRSVFARSVCKYGLRYVCVCVYVDLFYMYVSVCVRILRFYLFMLS